MRLIGHAQAGRAPTEELALQRKKPPYSPSPFRFQNESSRLKLICSEAYFTSHNSAGPLPKFSGLSKNITEPTPQALPVASSPTPGNGPVRVPPLVPDDIAKFASLFERSEVQNGLLSGIFFPKSTLVRLYQKQKLIT